MNRLNKKLVSMAGLLIAASLALAACQPAAATEAPTADVPTEAPAEPTEAATEAPEMEPTEAPIPQTGDLTPSVTVSDQELSDSSVTIDSVVSPGPGWMVIHADAGGSPGEVVGFSPLVEGENSDVVVEIDESKATETLYAMLHVDEGEVGVYEFPGADGPVMVDGSPVTPPFMVSGLEAGMDAAPEGEESGTDDMSEAANIHQQAVVEVSENEELGQFLVDDQGMTLYLFTVDEPNVSNCDAECLVRWPPLLTADDPVAGEGVDAAKLGAIPFDDEYRLVTYDGSPLYYWINDKQPGDTTGQGVGDVWYIVEP